MLKTLYNLFPGIKKWTIIYRYNELWTVSLSYILSVPSTYNARKVLLIILRFLVAFANLHFGKFINLKQTKYKTNYCRHENEKIDPLCLFQHFV